MTLFVSEFDDLGDLLLKHIASARRHVYVCSYWLTLPFILAELVKKARNGVEVRVVLAAEPENVQSCNFLRQHGVMVRLIRQAYGRVHAKFIIADDRAVVTTCNYTHDGLNNNFELAIVIEEKNDVEKLAAAFQRLFSDTK